MRTAIFILSLLFSLNSQAQTINYAYAKDTTGDSVKITFRILEDNGSSQCFVKTTCFKVLNMQMTTGFSIEHYILSDAYAAFKKDPLAYEAAILKLTITK